MRLSVSTDTGLYVLIGVAFVAGAGLATGSRWGQNVYPTRTVTKPAAPLGNASSRAAVAAAFDGKPAGTVSDEQCPTAVQVYSDGKSWLVKVCAP